MKFFTPLLLAGFLLASFTAPAQAAMAPTDFGRGMRNHDSRHDTRGKAPEFSFTKHRMIWPDERPQSALSTGHFNRADLYLKLAALSSGRHHDRDFRFFFPLFMRPPLAVAPVSPVPLPAALPLFGAGLVGLVAWRRRQSKA